MKISDSFISALAIYSHQNRNLPYYRIFERAGYKGHSSRITQVLNSDSLGESDQEIALKVAKIIKLKVEEVFE